MKKLLVVLMVLSGFSLAIPYGTPTEIAEVIFAEYQLVPASCPPEDLEGGEGDLGIACFKAPRGLGVQEAGDIVEERMMRVGFMPDMFGWMVIDENTGGAMLRSVEDNIMLIVRYAEGRLDFMLMDLSN